MSVGELTEFFPVGDFMTLQEEIWQRLKVPVSACRFSHKSMVLRLMLKPRLASFFQTIELDR
jgi:hypothetical protein